MKHRVSDAQGRGLDAVLSLRSGSPSLNRAGLHTIIAPTVLKALQILVMTSCEVMGWWSSLITPRCGFAATVEFTTNAASGSKMLARMGLRIL